MRISDPGSEPDAFDVLRACGLRIAESPHFRKDVTYIPESDLAMVRAGLTPSQRAEVVDYVLSQAVLIACESVAERPDDGGLAGVVAR